MQKISNKHLKWIKSLHQKKNRDLEQCFIVEGVKICDEVMRDHPEKIKDIVCTNEYFANISSSREEYGDSVPTITNKVEVGSENSSSTPGFDNTALTL